MAKQFSPFRHFTIQTFQVSKTWKVFLSNGQEPCIPKSIEGKRNVIVTSLQIYFRVIESYLLTSNVVP